MAARDLETFIRQQGALFDPNIDLSDGSPFDVRVVQPIVSRLGTDPFTVDMATFVQTRLQQAFPDMAIKEGDALTDLLNKPITLLWDPIVREIRHTRQQLSFKDPTVLTIDEAEALGANLFSDRRTGDFARGVGRIFFTQPQNVVISPVNFMTSRSGLHFFPSEIQSIRTEEMLLNLDSTGLYFFDVNVIAENPGTQYNLQPKSLASIANVGSAVRVTNVRRIRSGVDEETAAQFVDRARQELTERSLVTLRGIGAQLTRAFPEVRRLNAVGFNDPEMNRDIVTGGGLGDIITSGKAGSSTSDGEAKTFTRRFFTTEVDFTTLIGAPSVAPVNFVMTVFDAFGPLTAAQDLTVSRVVTANEIDFEEQVMAYSLIGSTPLRWVLRKRELTLSNIPGGILFPDGPLGTVTLPEGQVHIGGMTDMHVRGVEFEEQTLVIDNLVDDEPTLSGTQLFNTSDTKIIELQDLVLDGNYEVGDETFTTLQNARFFFFTLQILTGVDAGSYRIQEVTQVSGSSPLVQLERDTTAVAGSGPFQWKIVDQINLDLVEPRETKIDGGDLETVQGSDLVTTTAGTDFDAFGVAKDHVLRILAGPDAGDFTLKVSPIAPGFTTLQLSSAVTSSGSSIPYVIFRRNSEGGISRPIVRVTNVEILDSSNQPQGSIIPYALPVDIQSRAFQNPARGVKHDLADVRLGIVSVQVPTAGLALPGAATLQFNLLDGTATATLSLTGGTMKIAALLSEINAAMSAAFGIANAAVQVGTQGAFARGTITCVPASNIVDGETFTLDDGVNPAVTFEFDVTGGNTPAPGNIEIDLFAAGATTAEDVKTEVRVAINLAPSLNITASDGGVGVAALTHDDFLAAGNVPIVESVLDAAFLVTGMSGGVDGGDRVGIRPIGPGGKIALVGGSGRLALFGLAEPFTSFDVRSAVVDAAGGWTSLSPAIDFSSGLDVIQVLDGNQIDFYDAPYIVTSVDLGLGAGLETTSAVLVTDTSFLDFTTFGPEANIRTQFGARSIGSVRAFFLEPTSVEFDKDSRFSLTTDEGTVRFLPDPTLEYQKIPPLPGGSTPIDGAAPLSSGGATTIFTTLGSDLGLSGVKVGDILSIEHIPLGGDVILPDPVPSLVNETIVYSLDGAPDRTLIFIRDDVSLALDEVSRQGVVDQINASAGADICSLTGANELEFETDFDLTIRTTSSSLAAILGNIKGTTPPLAFAAGNATQRSNRSPHFGRHTVLVVSSTSVTTAAFSASGDFATYDDPVDRQSFKIFRPGAQRIVTTTMSENEAEADLFFFDVELVSEGTGDLWNIDAMEQLTASDFRSDGYFLTNDNEVLAFSDLEAIRMVLSRSILEVGVDDDPSNATQLSGQNIQITYDRSSLVTDVQNFISSETERVINQNPLARHLIPHFVRFDLEYFGGSAEEVVVPDVENLIRDLFPNELMEVSDIEGLILGRGATSITNPIDLIAIVHNTDRTIIAQRSQNALGTGRLSAFIPDRLSIVRNVTQ